METKLYTYDDYKNYFAKCRSPEKGRPFTNSFRLMKYGEDYTVCFQEYKYVGASIFMVSPDNTLTFVLPTRELIARPHTITGNLWKTGPISVDRKAKRLYTVRMLNSPKRHEYFSGIAFDLSKQECINPRPDFLDCIDKDKRKEWLRDVKRFKKGLKTRIKIGALDKIIDAAETGRTGANYWSSMGEAVTSLESTNVQQYILDCMRKNIYPPDILQLFVKTTSSPWPRLPLTREAVIMNVDYIFDKYSTDFRKLYGVFNVEQ